MVALKKGGIIIKVENRVLNKYIIFVIMIILIFILFYNTLYDTNTIIKADSKINEIKIAKEVNINELSKNNKEISTNYTRKISTTSRSKTSRDSEKEETKKEKTKIEQKYTKPKDVTITKNMNLTIRTSL